MAGFSEVAMSRRLQTMNPTQQSIQTLSMWLLHHQRSHAEDIVQVWLKEVNNETRPRNLINLLYLANDVIQNSRRQCPKFMDVFYEVLEPAFRHVSVHANAESVVAMKKILRVFRDRQIYSDAKVDRLVSAVASSLSGIRLVEFNIDLGGTSLALDKSRMTPTTPPISGKSASDSNTPSESPEPKKPRVESENFDIKAMTEVSENVVAILKRLEDPPSADTETRQLIASFPENIANPALLKSVKNEAQARELLAMIKEYKPVVKDFCKKLSAEMDDRRSLQQLLPEYSEFLKASAVRSNDVLRSLRGKIEKVDREKTAVQEHFNSLPDFSQSTTLTPLPSLGELFKRSKSDEEPS